MKLPNRDNFNGNQNDQQTDRQENSRRQRPDGQTFFRW
jgi:hypothetical protein